MTALDDALNESTRVYGQHPLYAYWRELDNVDLLTNPDAAANLSGQVSGGMTISHSMEDALPDPVTNSTSSDASGVLSATLTGREGLTLASSGQRAFHASGVTSGSATRTFSGAIPSTSQRGDFLICAVLVDDPSGVASIVHNAVDPKDTWKLVGWNISAPLGLYVFVTNRNYPGRAAPTFEASANVNYITMTTAFWALNPTNIPLSYRVNSSSFAAESTSRTSHTVGASLSNKGYEVGIWASEDTPGPWSYPSGGSEWGETVAVTLDLMMSTTPLRDSGIDTLTGVTTSSIAKALMASINIEPIARPRMDGRKWFSPFNTDSPIYGFDRDTATVLASIRVLTSSGFVDTQMFSGQMQGIPISGSSRLATLSAVSKTRIRLNRTVTLPIVNGPRRGLAVDWFVTWLASRASQFVGPAPNRYTRYWAPLHGSIQAHLEAKWSYNIMYKYSTDAPLTFIGTNDWQQVDGPYLLGMYAQQSATRTDVIRLSPQPEIYQASTTEFPHINDAGGPFGLDFFSQGNSSGRVSFWIRADPATSAPAYLPAGLDNLFSMQLRCFKGGVFYGWVVLGIDAANRRPYIVMGNDNVGYGTVTYAASGLLPTDGSWRFLSFWWDFAAGTARVFHNGTESTSSFWAGTYNDAASLPVTDEQGRRASYNTFFEVFFHLPASEFMYDTGYPYTGSPSTYADQYPTPQAPGGSLTIRPMNYQMQGIAEPTAVGLWDTLAGVARATLSSYRVNELDNLEFLPPSYFGETAQTTVSAVQDTRKNAEDLDVQIDSSKIRNVVTVAFQDTRVDSQPQPVLQYSSTLEIPKGQSFFTFPLDVPNTELHGIIDNSDSNINWRILGLSASQISTPSLPKNRHFITVNNQPDGSGTYYDRPRIWAFIEDFDAQSITLKFWNVTGGLAYLTNNGDQVPFLQILGYGVRAADGYVTARDDYSVLARGERGLDSEMPWIQDRSVASEIAQSLVSRISNPQPTLKLTVMGDPRRKPGQLITVLDADGTGAAGNWRILSIDHNLNGPEYTQDLFVVRVLPAAVWDGMDGWDAGTWS